MVLYSFLWSTQTIILRSHDQYIQSTILSSFSFHWLVRSIILLFLSLLDSKDRFIQSLCISILISFLIWLIIILIIILSSWFHWLIRTIIIRIISSSFTLISLIDSDDHSSYYYFYFLISLIHSDDHYSYSSSFFMISLDRYVRSYYSFLLLLCFH